MTKASSGYKGISRIDNGGTNTHGWYVRVTFDRKMHSRFFSDGKHGGKEKALKKAVKHRNDLEKELGKPRTDRIIVVSTSRNSTGIVGVQRTLKQKPTKKDVNPLAGAVYEVTWSPEANVLRKTSFSIEKYGEEVAFQKAVALRQQVEKKIFGRVIQTEIPSFPDVKARLDAKQLAKKLPRKKKGE